MKSKRFLSFVIALVFVMALFIPSVSFAEDAPAPTAVQAEAPPEQAPAEPTPEQSVEPTVEPSSAPTLAPSEEPTLVPSEAPSVDPSVEPTTEPSAEPTEMPSAQPTLEPSADPTVAPSAEPTASPLPSVEPTAPPMDPLAGDITAPKAKNITVLTPEIAAPGTLQVQFDLEDDTGIKELNFQIKSKLANGQTTTKFVGWSASSTNSTPLSTGLHTLSFAIDGSYPVNSYKITYLTLYDTVGNSSSYSSGDSLYSQADPNKMYGGYDSSLSTYAEEFSYQGNFRIVSSPAQDVLPPKAKNVKVLTPEIAAPGTLQVQFDLEDDTGIKELNFQIKSKLANGQTTTKFVGWSASSTNSTPLSTGLHTLSFAIDGSYPVNSYKITYLTLYDTVGNSSSYSSGDSLYSQADPNKMYGGYDSSLSTYAEEFSYQGNFRIVSSPAQDVLPPKAKNVKVLTPEIAAPGTLQVQFDLEDDTGVKEVVFHINSKLANGQTTTKFVWWSASSTNSIPLATGSHTLTFPIDPTYMENNYKITYLTLYDTVGNSSSYSSGDSLYSQADPNKMYGGYDSSLSTYAEEFSYQGSFRVNNETNVTVYSTTHDSNLINQINAMDEGCAAVVDYSYNKIAGADIFRAIAGKNKRIIFVKDSFQWVFDGMLIAPEKCKDIDLEVGMNIISAQSLGFENEKDVLQLSFAANGELPGRVDFRVYTEYTLAKYGAGFKDIFLTFFEGGQPASPSEPVIIAGDQYTTFQLTHNSTFILSTSKPLSISKLEILPVKATIGAKRSLQLVPSILPSHAKTPKLIWKSSNPKIATVDSKGIVKGLRKGTVTITASAQDGSGLVAKSKISVSTSLRPVTGIQLNSKSLNLRLKKTATLKASVAPGNATNRALVWTSSNPRVVTVDQKGKVKAVGLGRAFITATATDGSNKKVSCKVTVLQPVTKITLPKTAAVKVGKKVQVKATVTPANASNKKLIWKSSNPKIATVDSKGVVKGIRKGKVYIYAMASDGSNIKGRSIITVR